jgi:5-formyltetrahydrofolate cyclo-ligase
LGAKKAVRERMVSIRLAMDMDERSGKSTEICSRIEGMPEHVRQASPVLFYMPIRGEVDILPLLQKALEEGRRCALPKCAPGGKLRLYFISNLERDVAPGMWGIPEPVEGRARECTGETFSVIMVPGVAFSRRGERVGYGGGYYDRLLASSGSKSLKIAPAFVMQILPVLPNGPLDGLVDIIATENEIIDCRNAGGNKCQKK